MPSIESIRARLIACVLLALFMPRACAQTNLVNPKPEEVTEAYLREHYTKFEYKIPMRDGVKLFTSVYAPKDDSRP
jgi:predicted acyl esterase